MSTDIKNIFDHFEAAGEFVDSSPIVSGHINATYLVKTDSEASYVLQRINHSVFEKPQDVISNKIKVSAHLHKKLQDSPQSGSGTHVLNFIKSRSGENLYRDDGGYYWNMMDYIGNSRVYLKTPDRRIAFEAGLAFGRFLAMTEDLDPADIIETLPRFHSMALRFEQFDEALESASPERKELAAREIETAQGLRDEMLRLQALIDEGKIPDRVTHNDTKISNALFSDDGKALCVIDLDTVMRGVVHFDFGDAVRTICSSADEDEPDETKIDFSLDYFEAFVQGFVGKSGIRLSQTEIEGLPMSAKFMTFIVGLRFLTDFLNNDVYFDTKHERHNLDRARSQFRRVQLIGENLDKMKEIVVRESMKTRKRFGSRA